MSAVAPVRLVPLGGLGEVGMNCLVVESGASRVVVDCGVLFPHAEAALGVEVIAPELVHTSGHAFEMEQRMMIELSRPRSFLPVHGEYRMLRAHAQTASAAGVDPQACLVAEDGDIVELRRGEIPRVLPGAATAGRVYLDSREAAADVGEVALRDRQLLADAGMLLCLCVVDRKTGELVRGPELLGRGVAGLDEARLSQARAGAREAIAELGPQERRDLGALEAALRRGARSAFPRGVAKRPMILPVVVEM